jgi:hypothetical protein
LPRSLGSDKRQPSASLLSITFLIQLKGTMSVVSCLLSVVG